jgi:hypothetical protein
MVVKVVGPYGDPNLFGMWCAAPYIYEYEHQLDEGFHFRTHRAAIKYADRMARG